MVWITKLYIFTKFLLGLVYFGDSARGYVLSNTFFLKDAQARGFHRWYSIIVLMKDKHFLLNSWPFFQKYINQVVEKLQTKANQVNIFSLSNDFQIIIVWILYSIFIILIQYYFKNKEKQ